MGPSSDCGAASRSIVCMSFLAKPTLGVVYSQSTWRKWCSDYQVFIPLLLFCFLGAEQLTVLGSCKSTLFCILIFLSAELSEHSLNHFLQEVPQQLIASEVESNGNVEEGDNRQEEPTGPEVPAMAEYCQFGFSNEHGRQEDEAYDSSWVADVGKRKKGTSLVSKYVIQLTEESFFLGFFTMHLSGRSTRIPAIHRKRDTLLLLLPPAPPFPPLPPLFKIPL